jgi:hypothetical protein
MKSIEKFLLRIDTAPWSAVSRVLLGFCIPPVFHALSGGRDQIWISLALFALLLIGLRVGPAIMRMVLPFSRETKDIWFERRQIAKRYDSYQWQKLFWIGLGLVGYAAMAGGLSTGEQVVTLVCLVGGAAGLVLWRRTSAVPAPAGA